MTTGTSLQLTSLYLESPLGTIRIRGTSEVITEVHFLEAEELATADDNTGPAFDLIVKCRDQLEEYFQGNLKEFDISTNQAGTVFQQKVWQQLSVIRYGDTISYMTLARQLGDPKVIRAAASANGRNHIAIIVPCHRVMGSSGDLVGYAGGVWRKKWLIDHEQKFARGVRTLF